MEPMPLVGAEVQRVRTAFQAASMELSAALTAMSELDLGEFGTPGGDVVILDGLRDLRAALEHLHATAGDCVTVTGRHIPDDVPGPGRAVRDVAEEA